MCAHDNDDEKKVRQKSEKVAQSYGPWRWLELDRKNNPQITSSRDSRLSLPWHIIVIIVFVAFEKFVMGKMR